MDWEILEENWELILAILGMIWGLAGSIARRKADRRHQRFLEVHFSLLEKYEKAERSILNGFPKKDIEDGG